MSISLVKSTTANPEMEEEEEEEEEVRPLSLGMNIASGLIASNFFPLADFRKGAAVSLLLLNHLFFHIQCTGVEGYQYPRSL